MIERFIGNGLTVFHGRGARLAVVLAIAVFGAAVAPTLVRSSELAGAVGDVASLGALRPAVERAASVPDAPLPPVVAARLARFAGSEIPLQGIAAYAGRFPDLVKDDVFGLGRIRMAELLARHPQPGLRETGLDEVLADTYDLSDAAVLRFVDGARADPDVASRLVVAELAYQKKALATVYRIRIDDTNEAVLHAALRFGTQAGLIVDLMSASALALDEHLRTLPGGDFRADPEVMRATGARTGVELIQAFTGDIAPAAAPAGPSFR